VTSLPAVRDNSPARTSGSPLDGVKLHLVDNMAELVACWRWAAERRETPLAFDTESAGLEPHRHPDRLIQIGDKRHGWAFPARGWGGAATEILSRYDGELVAHNSPYDNRVLKIWEGFEPRWERTHDTLIGGHIADSLRTAKLKPRAAIEVDPRAIAGEQMMHAGMLKQHWTWATVPVSWGPYWAYGALDPVLTAWLWDKYGRTVTTQFRESYDLERATLRICANMMMTGMMIDVPYIQGAIARIEGYLAQASVILREHGISSVNSNQQVGRALNAAGVPTLVFTDGGQPSISKDALKLYRNTYPHARDLLAAIQWSRKGEAIIGRYLGKFLEMADADQIMHYTIWTSRARTTRMSITDPPMQTYDRDEPYIRGAYRPRPGHVFISIDADQIEARKAAHFSGDRQMIADFIEADRTGQSFFIIMASKIFGETISKKDPRYTRTKNATYGQIYGAGLEKAAVTAGVPVEVMRPSYMGFQQLYPGVNALMNKLINDGKRMRRPEVRTLTGRRLYSEKGKEYALLNYKIQGSAAETMKRGIVNLEAAGFGEYLRLPIHDEILMEVPEKLAAEALAEATRILTDRTSFAVPITWAGSILKDRWVKT
jgi:DNA polymerase-1